MSKTIVNIKLKTNTKKSNLILNEYLKLDKNNELFIKIFKQNKVSLKLKLNSFNSNILFITLISKLHKISLDLNLTFKIILKNKNYKEKILFNGGYVDRKLNKLFFFKDMKKLNELSKQKFKDLHLSGEVFYDCNFPIEVEGFKIMELSDDIYKYEKEDI